MNLYLLKNRKLITSTENLDKDKNYVHKRSRDLLEILSQKMYKISNYITKVVVLCLTYIEPSSIFFNTHLQVESLIIIIIIFRL